MELRYRYRIRVSDLWQVSMYYAWSSYLALINAVCIVSSIALIVSCWRDAGTGFRLGMVLFASLFLVIQPLVIWNRARKQVSKDGPEMELYFGGNGLTITSEGRQEIKTWAQIRSILVKPTLVVIYVDGNRGYILRNRVLGETRDELIRYVKKNIRH